MGMLKQNKKNILLSFLFFVSCKETTKQSFSLSDCEKYIAAKQGFWIDISSSNINENNITFCYGHKKIIPQKINRKEGHFIFFVKDPIQLNDTIKILYNNEKYDLYNFTNITEMAINGSNHEKVNICRVSKAKINKNIIHDSNNNILKFEIK